MGFPLVVLAGIVCCVALARHARGSSRNLDHLDELLASRVTPVVLGVVNAVLVWWWVGWYLNPAPMVHDEAAYLLQAALFAQGRWTGEARPIAEFFAQMHVLTEPVLASKYPPGLSLFLTPFVALRFAALAPMTLAAVTGALIFILARRIAGGTVALLAWLLWSSGPAVLRYQASFLSQTLTVALWLAVLYCVLEYHARRQPRMLVALAVSIGSMAITRPVTAVALALPVGIVVIRHVIRDRAWSSLVRPALVMIGLLAVLPLQNRMTTGSWRRSPLVEYSERYTPFDFPGFGYTPPPDLAPLPPDLDSLRTFLADARRDHTLPALPATLRSRVWYVTFDIFSGWRAPFLLFAILGALVMPSAGRFALCASLGLVLTYAFHAHWPRWTVYYLEGYPAVIFASAVGLRAFAERVVERRSLWRRLALGPPSDARVRGALIALCTVIVIPGSMILPQYRAAWQRTTIYQRRFVTVLDLVRRESPRSIVFVDYGHGHDMHSSLVWNVPDLERAPTWIAYERGPDDLRLMRLAPDRRGYIFHADQGRLIRLPPLGDLERVTAARGR